MRYIAITVIILSFLNFSAFAQKDSVWVLKVIKKGNAFNPGKDDYMPGSKGFYFYEGCIYDIVLKNDDTYTAKILSIKKDSIEFTTPINAVYALQNREHFDTLTISPSQIKKIRLLADRIMGLYSNVHMRNYNFEYAKDTTAKRMAADTLTDTITTIKYLIMPYLTAQGLDPQYVAIDTLDKSKITATVPPAKVKQDSVFRKRNFGWFLPLNASEVNGIALGLHTGNINELPLKINGINADADIMSMFVTMFILPFHFLDAGNVKRLSDTLETNGLITINGLSVSGGGITYGKKLSGLFISGGICEANTANGIFITGGFNYFHSVKGISIGGLRNTAVKCSGIQIGLINVCKHLKGLQIGLWNVNSKRKLPLINWGT